MTYVRVTTGDIPFSSRYACRFRLIPVGISFRRDCFHRSGFFNKQTGISAQPEADDHMATVCMLPRPEPAGGAAE
jgi:hypothetical protein